MADELRIDSHKLIFHPQRVAEWLKGKNIYPLEVEIAPSGGCNHRCLFCALDYMEYKPVLLEKKLILKNLKEMAEKGLKSVIFAGEGEPLLNKKTPEIINTTKSYGIDTAMSTNGVLLTREVTEECLKSLTWIRFSVSAGTSATYDLIHRGKSGDFEKAVENIRQAVVVKKSRNLDTTLGVQLLLIPENIKEVVTLAKLLREIGVDYFTVKPFSKHPKSNCSIDSEFNYQDYIDLERQLNELETDAYRIYFRENSMKKKASGKIYDKCFGLPFFTYIDANGQVWPCIAFLGDNELCFGSLKELSFVEIWEGKRRTEILGIFDAMDIKKCRELCRLDEINSYLHQLKHPGAHVNFI